MLLVSDIAVYSQALFWAATEWMLFLSFFSAKPKITYVENKTAMELEDQITLTCEASGDPIPSITWRTSTRNISNEEKVSPLPKTWSHWQGSVLLLPSCLCWYTLHDGNSQMHVEIMVIPCLRRENTCSPAQTVYWRASSTAEVMP